VWGVGVSDVTINGGGAIDGGGIVSDGEHAYSRSATHSPTYPPPPPSTNLPIHPPTHPPIHLKCPPIHLYSPICPPPLHPRIHTRTHSHTLTCSLIRNRAILTHSETCLGGGDKVLFFKLWAAHVMLICSLIRPFIHPYSLLYQTLRLGEVTRCSPSSCRLESPSKTSPSDRALVTLCCSQRVRCTL
jgi:hypothetical protein